MRIINYILLIMIFAACKNQPDLQSERLFVEEKPPIPIKVVNDEKDSIQKFVNDTSAWRDLKLIDPDFILDIRYATANNFVGEQIYECGKCLLRKEAAKALLKVHKKFKQLGYRIKLFDCYRPHPAQQKLWDKVPNASYVTPPWKGSNHNKGLAVDLTLVDEDGDELAMGSGYDFFGKEAHHDHLDHPETVLANRLLLKNTLKEVGFSSIRTEWWHYNFYGVKYPVSDMEWECQ